MSSASTQFDTIVDTALDRAELVGWGPLRLRDVAADLKIPLAGIRAHFGEKNDIADAWLARADDAMLGQMPEGFAGMPPPERLHVVMMRWFDALAPHREVTAAMLGDKLWVFHPHHYIPMIPWTSRTVQWMRASALLDGQGRRRQVEEIGLTATFIATLSFWSRDTSDGQEMTRTWLSRRLERADHLMLWLKPVLPPA